MISGRLGTQNYYRFAIFYDLYHSLFMPYFPATSYNCTGIAASFLSLLAIVCVSFLCMSYYELQRETNPDTLYDVVPRIWSYMYMYRM